MFSAMDRVIYSTLQLGHNQEPEEEGRPEGSPSTAPDSLEQQCYTALFRSVSTPASHGDLMAEAMNTLPEQIGNMLLVEAERRSDGPAIVHIVSVWQRDTLCLREILPASILETNKTFGSHLFEGLTQRQECCKMTCLDLRGFQLDSDGKFYRQMVIGLPILSIPLPAGAVKVSLDFLDDLVGMVLQNVEKNGTLYIKRERSSTWKKRLIHIMAEYRRKEMRALEGCQLTVKLDKVSLPLLDDCLDYMLLQYLKDVISVKLQISQFVARSVGDSRGCSFMCCVLHYHVTERLEGLEVPSYCYREDTEIDAALMEVAQCVSRFRYLRALDLSGWKTFVEEHCRCRMLAVLRSFPHLIRLSLAETLLTGSLGQILDAVQKPLEYLNLRHCRMNESDVAALVRSTHAGSLLELDLNMFPVRVSDDYWEPSVALEVKLIRVLKSFPRLNILNLKHRCLSNCHVDVFCDVLTNHLPELKVLELTMECADVTRTSSAESPLKVTLACATIPSFQKLSISLDLKRGASGRRRGSNTMHLADFVNSNLRKVQRGDVRFCFI